MQTLVRARTHAVAPSASATAAETSSFVQKYFLQILAGISNAEIVLDPEGQLLPGVVQRIPFKLTEADAGADVILLTPNPRIVDFRIQTPIGMIIDPATTQAEPGMAYVLSDGVTYYRLVLPVELSPSRFEQPGTWHALLRLGKPRDPGGGGGDRPGESGDRLLEHARFMAARPNFESSALAAVGQSVHGLPYSLVVHSYSNLSLRAALDQASFEPGAEVGLHATLAEAGVPARAGAHVWAEVTRPDATFASVDLHEGDPGQFSGAFATSVAGVYRIRVRASGVSTAGYPFQREQLLTAAVWRGGDSVTDPGGGSVGWLQEWDQRLCRLLKCILGEGGVITAEAERRLRSEGVDIAALRKCLEVYCRAAHRSEPPADG